MPTRPASLVTGAASGLGRAIAIALAAAGHDLTLLDLDPTGLEETARLACLAPAGVGARIHLEAFNIADAGRQQAAFARHAAEFRRLDAAVLNAGIGERGAFFEDDATGWQDTLDVDLTAVLVGIKCAAAAMRQTKRRGAILSIASAGGIFPMPASPIYAAAKGALVHFTRSAAPQLDRHHGIRLHALCPEFVDTPMVSLLLSQPETARRVMGRLDVPLLRPRQVADVAMELLLQPRHPAGTVVLVRQDGSELLMFPQPRTAVPFAKATRPFVRLGTQPSETGELSAAAGGAPTTAAAAAAAAVAQAGRASWAGAGQLPGSFRKIVVHTLSTDFGAATRIVEAPLPGGTGGTPLPAGQLLVRRAYVGINASDINYSAGRYHSSVKAAQAELPYDAGFESVGIVAAVGAGVTGFAPGDAVAAMSYGAFSEYGVVPAQQALPVSRATPQVVALLTSGLTASIALEEAGRMRRGDVVLVTAAAGGTGQFAVQLAKLAGCTVIATCSGGDKVALLKRLGADRVINYKTEKLQAVLKAEYPRGMDVVYESVGGDMFNACLNALAPRGRLVVIGMISQYEAGWPAATYPGLAEKLLWKSASVSGFFLLKHAHLFKTHLQRLVQLVESGALHVEIDQGPFVGLEDVGRAVKWLYSGSSVGKIVVQVAAEAPPQEVDALALHAAPLRPPVSKM